jgi:molybdopterin converting factor small subunit
MKVAIIPDFAALKIRVNPDSKAMQGARGSFEPGLYVPWPEAREKGMIELAIEGETLRVLLAAISEIYRQANVDFQPICHITNDIGSEYDVSVNGKNYILLPQGLNTKLKDGDEVRVKGDETGHC